MVRSHYFKGKRGVTLVESLIATLIMALGLFAVGTAIYAQFSSLNQNREKAIAALAAQEEMENIRGMPFDSILALGSNFNFTSSGFTYLQNSTGTGTIDDPLGTGGSDIRRVSLNVSWRSITGRTLSKKLATFVMRSGIDKQ